MSDNERKRQQEIKRQQERDREKRERQIDKSRRSTPTRGIGSGDRPKRKSRK